MSTTTVDQDEIRRFAAMAPDWWDPEGPMRPLHRMGPARMRYLSDRLKRHFGHGNTDAGSDMPAGAPLQGLRILDIGCGGGLISEPLARLGASVTGVDATAENIAAAKDHAARGGLDIDYRHTTAEDLADIADARPETRFDAVMALEIIEHVADPALFVQSLSRLVRPGGLVVFSTLNRTPKAWGLAIFGAERVMRWLPAGTHTYAKFVRPSELAAHCRRSGLAVTDVCGLVFSPLSGWTLNSRDLDVNYFATAKAAPEPGQEAEAEAEAEAASATTDP